MDRVCRYEHLVRYVGWYSNRSRGERVKKISAGLLGKSAIATYFDLYNRIRPHQGLG